MAFGLFVAEFGSQGLPLAYVSIAVLASITAIAYLKLSEHVSFATLLTINLSFLAAGCVLFWAGLASPLARSFTFLLPLWFQVLLNLGNLAVWSLAGRIFDVRQGKRLFALVGAGNWIANIIGGWSVPLLIGWIGTSNLLLCAAISVGVALGRSPSSVKPAPRLLNSRYVQLIFVYVILWWIAFFFVDNIFFDRAAAQYPDAAQLTAFMGLLVAAIGVVALITTTFISCISDHRSSVDRVGGVVAPPVPEGLGERPGKTAIGRDAASFDRSGQCGDLARRFAQPAPCSGDLCAGPAGADWALISTRCLA
jgi:AAA family ATP:ADP antiporter